MFIFFTRFEKAEFQTESSHYSITRILSAWEHPTMAKSCIYEQLVFQNDDIYKKRSGNHF